MKTLAEKIANITVSAPLNNISPEQEEENQNKIKELPKDIFFNYINAVINDEVLTNYHFLKQNALKKYDQIKETNKKIQNNKNTKKEKKKEPDEEKKEEVKPLPEKDLEELPQMPQKEVNIPKKEDVLKKKEPEELEELPQEIISAPKKEKEE